jgi:hypothetical protein
MIAQINLLYDRVLPRNSWVLDQYIGSLHPLHFILMSTLPCLDELESNLAESTKLFMESEESRTERKLAALDYEIDGPETLALILGRYQIERVGKHQLSELLLILITYLQYFYPLVYLLLKHHLVVMRMGFHHIFDADKIQTMFLSLATIFQAVESRIAALRGELLLTSTTKNYSLTLCSHFCPEKA